MKRGGNQKYKVARQFHRGGTESTEINFQRVH